MEGTTAAPATGRRCFWYWLFASWVSVPIAIIAIGALPFADDARAMWMPLLLEELVWPILGIASLVWGIRLALKCLWWRSALACVLPVFVVVNFTTFWGLQPINQASHILHFATMKASYDREISRLPVDRPRLKIFIWEDDPVGGSGVAYDATDEISLPKARRSKSWSKSWSTRAQPYQHLGELCQVDPLWSHYYLIFFGCSIDPR